MLCEKLSRESSLLEKKYYNADFDGIVIHRYVYYAYTRRK